MPTPLQPPSSPAASMPPPAPLSMQPGDAPPAAVQEPPDARRARERFDLLLGQLSAEFSAAQLGDYKAAPRPSAQPRPAVRGSAGLGLVGRGSSSLGLGRASGETGPPVNSAGLANGSEPPSVQAERQASADAARDAPSLADDRELFAPLALFGEHKTNEAVGRRGEDAVEISQAEAAEQKHDGKTKHHSLGVSVHSKASKEVPAPASEEVPGRRQHPEELDLPVDALTIFQPLQLKAKGRGADKGPGPRGRDRRQTPPAGSLQHPLEGLPQVAAPAPLHALMNRLGDLGSTKAIRDTSLMRRMGSSRPRHRARQMLNSSWFDNVMGLVIFANSIQIGMESSSRLDGVEVPAFAVMEWVFLVTYIVELGLRIFAFRRRCFQSGWVQFDAFLVVVGIAGAIAEPIIATTADAGGTNLMGPVMALRVFRLFRLARAVRLLVQFRTLWLLLQGLFSSAGTIVYTFCLLIIILYIFSCIAMEMITIPWSKTPPGESPEVKMIVDRFWPNLPTAMLSLVQFVFLDSVASIYTPMIHNDYKTLIFFIPFLMIVSIALMNLVTAVLVEGSLAQANTDKDEQLQAMLPVLREAFELMDVDQSGTLNWQEVQAVNEEGQEHLKKYLGGESLLQLFEMLEADESGEVDIETFCGGITTLTQCGKPIEFFRILNKVNNIEEKIIAMEASLGSLAKTLGDVLRRPRAAGVDEPSRGESHPRVRGGRSESGDSGADVDVTF